MYIVSSNKSENGRVIYVSIITGNLVEIDFENSTYFANESNGELCGMIIVTMGQPEEPFDVSAVPLQTMPVSAEGSLNCR